MRSFAHQRVRPREVEDPPRLGEGEILRDHHLDNPDVEVRGEVVVFRSRWLPSAGVGLPEVPIHSLELLVHLRVVDPATGFGR